MIGQCFTKCYTSSLCIVAVSEEECNPHHVLFMVMSFTLYSVNHSFFLVPLFSSTSPTQLLLFSHLLICSHLLFRSLPQPVTDRLVTPCRPWSKHHSAPWSLKCLFINKWCSICFKIEHKKSGKKCLHNIYGNQPSKVVQILDRARIEITHTV